MSTVLFIDGRNFLGLLDNTIAAPHQERPRIDHSTYDFDGLFRTVLRQVSVDRRIFYLGKVIPHAAAPIKSELFRRQQRQLTKCLKKQGFEIILAGPVRAHTTQCPRGHEFLAFKEKGIDVRLAVDMISMACQGNLKTLH